MTQSFQSAKDLYESGDLDSAANLLRPLTSSPDASSHCNKQALHNLALIESSKGKHHTAGFYLMQAVQLSKGDSSDADGYRYIYAAGLEHLSLGNTQTAASCFRTSALLEPALHNKPLFWIRLAECCLQSYTGDNAAVHATSIGVSSSIQDALKDDPPNLSFSAAEEYLRMGEECIDKSGKEMSEEDGKVKEHIKYLKRCMPAGNSQVPGN
jgi:tetratricopeptide (TPR) repeat protein